MAQDIIADQQKEMTTEVASRIKRGVALYSELHEEIQTQHHGIYRIPSSTGRGYYRVIIDDAGERCNCADRRGHKLGVCKHIAAALIADAKRPTYRVRKTQGDLYELLEKRSGIEMVIEWGTCSKVYHEKWALENPDWDWEVA